MTARDLLGYLPEFEGREEMIQEKQDVQDIIKEVVNAHKVFAPQYDKISRFFISKDIPNKIFDFCKKNLRYSVESESLQTTRSPSGILAMCDVGCDCKHYAGFVGGVIDSLNRQGLTSLDWCYRFVSYNLFDAQPQHVFIVVTDDNGSELWIDPVLGYLDSRTPDPIYITDKKVKSKKMSLVRISGLNPPGITSTNIVRRSDLIKNTPTCGCACDDNKVNGVNVMDLISANPVESLLIAGAATVILYKIFK